MVAAVFILPQLAILGQHQAKTLREDDRAVARSLVVYGDDLPALGDRGDIVSLDFNLVFVGQPEEAVFLEDAIHRSATLTG